MFHCEVSLQASGKWENVLKHKMKARIVTSLTVTAGYDTSISFREELQVICTYAIFILFKTTEIKRSTAHKVLSRLDVS